MRIGEGLTEQAGEQGHEDEADQSDAAAGHELFHTLAISSGVVIAVALEQVNCAPNGEAGTESDHEGLEDIDCAVKEIHNIVAGINLRKSEMKTSDMQKPERYRLRRDDSGVSFQLLNCRTGIAEKSRCLVFFGGGIYINSSAG